MGRGVDSDWLDRVAEAVGALALALGAGVSTFVWASRHGEAAAWPWSGAAALAGLIAGWTAMRVVPRQARTLPLPDFEAVDVEPSAAEDTLELDDILAELGPDSRVVRLFSADASPTAGQLQARIDRHLSGAPASPDPRGPDRNDASEALHAALDEIRRSLRQG